MFNFIDIQHENFALKFLKSDVFDESLVNLFSTRVGGDTPKPLQSFTLSAKDYTQYDGYATKNLKIVCDILGSSYENLIMPNQQHTDKIAVIKNSGDILTLKKEPFDGVITNLKNFPVCLVFADCVPVLLYDKKQKVLAAIHAGWKGTAKSIAAKAVEMMKTEFGSDVFDISAAIGAAICQNCFEVNSDVSGQLAMSIKNPCGNIFLEQDGKVHVDLKILNKVQLNEAGVRNVDICGYCTCCNNDIFYSYRADNKITGRHGMIAMIKE